MLAGRIGSLSSPGAWKRTVLAVMPGGHCAVILMGRMMSEAQVSTCVRKVVTLWVFRVVG
ncbi:hypothetical protein [Streptomyces sp. NPDC001508]|uniref:hypothetical protein n=1 Tax=Streptomyces sp. NPDC001508 TaxID=3154656 RepID=UPI003322518E